MNDVSSGSSQPVQCRGHSKVTCPPFVRTCSASCENFRSNFLECARSSLSFAMNLGPKRDLFTCCHADQAVQ
eukprot:1023003-Karenia_brevis.AAC.1